MLLPYNNYVEYFFYCFKFINCLMNAHMMKSVLKFLLNLISRCGEKISIKKLNIYMDFLQHLGLATFFDEYEHKNSGNVINVRETAPAQISLASEPQLCQQSLKKKTFYMEIN